MFDVIWTDPDRELVGEHRARKEKKKEQKEKQKALASRSSLSTRSSRSSVDSPFGFLRSRGLRSVNSSKANSKAKSTASSGLLTPSIISSRSPMSIDSDGASYRHSIAILDHSDHYSERTRALDRRGRPNLNQDAGEGSSSLSLKRVKEDKEEETTGTCAQKGLENNEPPKLSRLVQKLGPSSYVTKKTEVSWVSRNLRSDDTELSSEVFISSEPDMDQPLTPPTSPGDRSIPTSCDLVDSPVNFAPGKKGSSQPKSPMWAVNFKPNNPDAWKPPDEWDCTPTEPRSAATRLEDLMNEMLSAALTDEVPEDTVDLSALQKEVRRMAAASPQAILSRLEAIWDTTLNPSLHQELEMEKKRWMLSTLHHLDPVPDLDVSQLRLGDGSSKVRRILALYESKVTASYLAALHFTKHIYHLSATPLSHALFPNVHPILVPSASPSVFPVAQELFDSVYSISLPAICSSQDIPGVLRNIYKCLKPGGTLQLTLIDPLPCAGTLGQRMRAWLEEHLLLNLEKNFRCMNPSRVFPHWLGDAALRGRGSTLTTAKFYAVPASARGHEADPDPFIEQVRTEKEIKAELRSLVGRMLWMEVWGAYVTAGRWWWEDQGCVEECLQLGTFWEYNVIEGVKDKTA